MDNAVNIVSPSNENARTLDRGLAILDMLAATKRPTSLTKIALELEMDKSTVHRLLQTLIRRDYVQRDARSRLYTLGLHVLTLHDSLQSHIGLQERLHPVLEDLTSFSEETSHLAVLSKEDIVFIDWVDSPQIMRIRTVIGRREPAYCTALGKAILFALEPGACQAILAQTRFVAYTGNTLLSPESVRSDLDLSVRRGWALDNEEFLEGVRCLAAPVFDRSHAATAALGISAPAVRLSLAQCAQLGSHIAAMAHRASLLLGCPGEKERRPYPNAR